MMCCCMRYLTPVSVLPAVDDCSPCVEKQCIEAAGKQSIVLLNGTDSKMYFNHLKCL